jgi:hypothetical protein
MPALITICSPTADADPKTALGYTKRAAALLHQRKNADALKDLDRAVTVDTSFVQGFLHRGKLLRQTGR